MSTAPASAPNPGVIFETLNAYQRSMALKAAIDLDLFTAIAGGSQTAGAIAVAAGASPRGVRILCDYLVICGFLSKSGSGYSPSAEAAMFLDRNSPSYLGSAASFLLNPRMIAPYLELQQVVRSGRTTLPDEGSVSPDNPIWVDFARQMAPLMVPAAQAIAELLKSAGPFRVLDVAAGHGLFGITIAQRNPEARITALDWPGVLAVATENAAKSGVADRHSMLAGDAFQTDFGGPYDVVLVTNFLHHFDAAACETLLSKVLAALTPKGRCVVLEFVPDEDRVSPPIPASFAMTMLGTTVSGDAYPFSEYEKMFRNAGFAPPELHRLGEAPESVIIARRG